MVNDLSGCEVVGLVRPSCWSGLVVEWGVVFGLFVFLLGVFVWLKWYNKEVD